jgi:hypothetical protein
MSQKKGNGDANLLCRATHAFLSPIVGSLLSTRRDLMALSLRVEYETLGNGWDTSSLDLPFTPIRLDHCAFVFLSLVEEGAEVTMVIEQPRSM